MARNLVNRYTQAYTELKLLMLEVAKSVQASFKFSIQQKFIASSLPQNASPTHLLE